MKSKDLSRNAKKKIYRTVIRPIVTYASENWCMVKDDERMISTWERKILRRIYGPKFENGEWQSRGNMELYGLYQEPQIVGVIKSSRLRWAGHIERSEESTLLSRIYRDHPGGKRCVERPRKKWINDVIEDLEEMGVRMWKRIVQIRET